MEDQCIHSSDTVIGPGVGMRLWLANQNPSLGFAMDIEKEIVSFSRLLSCKGLKSLELLATILLSHGKKQIKDEKNKLKRRQAELKDTERRSDRLRYCLNLQIQLCLRSISQTFQFHEASAPHPAKELQCE